MLLLAELLARTFAFYFDNKICLNINIHTSVEVVSLFEPSQSRGESKWGSTRTDTAMRDRMIGSQRLLPLGQNIKNSCVNAFLFETFHRVLII